MHRPLAFIFAPLLLAACSLAPSYQRPALEMPAQWSAGAADAAAQAPGAGWWSRYGSAELDRLMQQALAANHDLAAAVARIEQTRASVRSAGSTLLPGVDASVSASRNRQGDGEDRLLSSSDQALLSVGYELDLWGANRASLQAAEARLAASVYDRDAVALVLQADVASYYFQTLALQDRLAIAQKNLEAARQLLSLVQVRVDNGGATALDLAQQKTSALSIEAQIPALRENLATTRNALAVLLGRAPQDLAIEATSLASLQLPEVDAGQPASLLERRPDIRAAEAGLVAANADIGTARAALFPSLELSASAGASGLLTGGSGTVAALAASLAQTVFDGGARSAQLQQSRAVYVELTQTYAQAVLTSLQEVQDGLAGVDSNREQSRLLEQAAENAREAYRLALIRYESGAEDLLTLLDSQRSLLDAEDSLVQAHLGRYTASASLFKALGGGWQSSAAA